MARDPFRPPTDRRLTRSSRDKMLAGVAGGLGNYFDVDPVLVRLIFVAAMVLSGGAAFIGYIALWFVMPLDEDPVRGPRDLRTMSQQFQADAQRVAEDVRRMGEEFGTGARPGSSAAAPAAESGATTATVADVSADPAADFGAASTKRTFTFDDVPPPPPAPAAPGEDWYATPEERTQRRQKVAGVILVGLGILFMANEAGIFRFMNWKLMWPLVLVALGALLLMRQADWRR